VRGLDRQRSIRAGDGYQDVKMTKMIMKQQTLPTARFIASVRRSNEIDLLGPAR
jgi:hypothetical protein